MNYIFILPATLLYVVHSQRFFYSNVPYDEQLTPCAAQYNTKLATIENQDDLNDIPPERVIDIGGLALIGLNCVDNTICEFMDGSDPSFAMSLFTPDINLGACVVIDEFGQLQSWDCSHDVGYICNGPTYPECLKDGYEVTAFHIDKSQHPWGSNNLENEKVSSCDEYCTMVINNQVPGLCQGYTFEQLENEGAGNCQVMHQFDYLSGTNTNANVQSGSYLCRNNVRYKNICLSGREHNFDGVPEPWPYGDIGYDKNNHGARQYIMGGYSGGYPRYRAELAEGEAIMEYSNSIPYNSNGNELIDDPNGINGWKIVINGFDLNNFIVAYCLNEQVEFCCHEWYVINDNTGNYERDNNMDVYRCSTQNGGGDPFCTGDIWEMVAGNWEFNMDANPNTGSESLDTCYMDAKGIPGGDYFHSHLIQVSPTILDGMTDGTVGVNVIINEDTANAGIFLRSSPGNNDIFDGYYFGVDVLRI
eukprot:368573_1